MRVADTRLPADGCPFEQADQAPIRIEVLWACATPARRPLGRVVAFSDQAIGLGVPIETPQRRDQVFGRIPASSGVASDDDLAFGLFGELFDLQRSRLG
jgi:hypothetical protein